MQRVQVRYEFSKRAQKMPGRRHQKLADPLHGKAYVVWAQGGDVAATTARGGAVSREEMAALSRDWDAELGQVPPVEQFFVGRTWIIGEKTTLTNEELVLMEEWDPDTDVRSGTALLTAFDDNTATFVIELDLDGRSPEGTVSMQPTMTVTLDTNTTWPRSILVSGTTSSVVAGVPATGTFEGKTLFEYL